MTSEEDVSFETLFASAQHKSHEIARAADTKQQKLLRAERLYVKKQVDAAAAVGKRTCRLSNHAVSRSTMAEVMKHFKVKEAHEGINPSTHDAMFVGWDISW